MLLVWIDRLHLEKVLGNQEKARSSRMWTRTAQRLPRASAPSGARLRARRSSPAVRGCRSRSSASRARPGKPAARFGIGPDSQVPDRVRARFRPESDRELTPDRTFLLAGSARRVPLARSLRLALRWWAFDAKEPSGTRTSLAGSIFVSFSVYSLISHDARLRNTVRDSYNCILAVL